MAKRQKSSLLQPAVCLSDLTETSSRFDLAGTPEALAHLRPWPNTVGLLESVLRGLCRVERAVEGQSSSPFTTFSTQHGRHTLVFGTSPSIEWVLNAVIFFYRGDGATLIWAIWGTCKWIFFFIRVGTVISKCVFYIALKTALLCCFYLLIHRNIKAHFQIYFSIFLLW